MPADVAIPRLLDLYGPRIHALAVRLCGSQEQAEDVVQETFLTAWRKWDQFRGEADPGTWLHIIAVRLCRKMQRRPGTARRMPTLSSLMPFDERGVPELRDVSQRGPSQRAAESEAKSKLEDAIAQLPLTFRMPIVLKEILEFPVSDVAAILGVNENTVKTRLHRARLMMRKVLVDGKPQRAAPPPPYDVQTCLDLLAAKQEALDRGVPFPGESKVVCERCRGVFKSLQMVSDTCSKLAAGEMPGKVRETVLWNLAQQSVADGSTGQRITERASASRRGRRRAR